MEQEIVGITVYDKRVQMTWEMYAVPLGDQVYRAVENELFGEITIGTEFRTWINKDGAHQIVKILKRSPYITRRFMLSPNIPTADYRLLGDAIEEQGGTWQVEMGGIATVSLPPDSTLDLDEIFRIFGHWPLEIKNDL